MPYIKKWGTHTFYPIISEQYHNSGELNYSLTRLCLIYLKDRTECYQTYNDIIGALECCKQEIYRRKISDYENKKCQENGDVF